MRIMVKMASESPQEFKALEVINLRKRYGDVEALKGVSFHVRPGEIYGLLGPNGAGKTTTVKNIVGILKPDAGTIKVYGFSPSENPIAVKERLGYVPEEIILYDSLTVKEMIEFVASIRVTNRPLTPVISTLLKAFDIEKYYTSTIATLSQGTKQKVAIILAFMAEPPLLILDEPIKGLDARSARIFKELLQIHIKRGGAILFSTHIMEIAQQLCHRIGIIHQGRIVVEGTVHELQETIESGENKTLEQIFLEITEQTSEVDKIVNMLREVFR